MEPSESPPAEAESQPVAEAVESAPEQSAEQTRNAFNDAFRAAARGVQMEASNQAPSDQADEDAEAPSEQSASDGVSADGQETAEASSAAQPRPSRRGKKEAANQQTIESLQSEIARLRQDLEAAPERVRQQLAVEQQQQAGASQAAEDAARYEQLINTPDHLLTGEDYQWREEYKDNLSRFPKVREHYEQRTRSERDQFLSTMRAQIASAGTLPGVDAETFKTPGTTWADMARHIHAAGVETGKSESADRVAALEAELADIKRQALAASSGGLVETGGRSGGRSGLNGDDWFRQAAQRARVS